MYAVNRTTQVAHVTAIIVLPALATVAALVFFPPTAAALVSLGVMYWLSSVGVELGFHRGLSHRAFDAKPGVWSVLIALGGIAAQGPGLYWAALHRHHHAHSDTAEDPHSPNQQPGLRGFWRGHLGWMFEPPPDEMFALISDLREQRALRRVDSLYALWVLLGLAVPTVAVGLWEGSLAGALNGLFWGGGVRLFLSQHSIWSINSVTHRYGTRRYASRDRSTDLGVLSLVTLGGSLHNTHHAFPFTSNNALSKGQVDPGHLVLRALRAVGLAWDLKEPSAEIIERQRLPATRLAP